MMNTVLNRIGVLIAVTACMFAFAPLAAQAQIVSGNLEVQYQELPLFNKADVLPGTSVARTVTVTNNGSDTEALYTSTDNESSTGLAALMEIDISESGGATYLATTTFDALFASGPVSLGSVAGGQTRTFVYTAELPASVTTGYAGTQMQFDIIVGFEGGASVSDGGGGGGGGSNNDDDDEDDDLPPGIVAGATTDTPWNTFVDGLGAAGDALRSMVAGASASAQGEGATSTTATSGGTVEREASGAVASTAAEIMWGESLCTFWWLFLLAVIMLAWSWFDDIHRSGNPARRRLFISNAVFGGVYLAALLGFHIFGVLEQLWWLFAASWAAMVVADYRAHLKIPGWDPTHRNWFYAAAGWLFITTSFFFGFPCVWWPFFGLLVISGIVFILQTDD